jgi:amidase
LVSRAGIVPLALSFDTGGPIARNVTDIAVSLGVMTGVDPNDSATAASAGHFKKDYTPYLKKGSLKGARIGVARDFMGQDAGTDAVIEEAIKTLTKLGAVVVDPVRFPDYLLQLKSPISSIIVNAEFKAQITDYLKTLKPGYPKSFDELVEKANDPAFGYRSPGKMVGFKYQQKVALSLDDPEYLAAKNEGLATIKAGILSLFKKYNLDAIVYPTSPRPATLIDAPTTGGGGPTGSATSFANETGFPDLIVPAGVTSGGLPVTISFFGVAWSEPKLLGYGYDFEQATYARILPKTTPALPTDSISF